MGETVRPQAIPLPDLERTVTTPGATARERVVEIAMQEWRRWGSCRPCAWAATITSCVTFSPLPAPAIRNRTARFRIPEFLPTGQPLTGKPIPTAAGQAVFRFPGRHGHGSQPPLGCQMARRYWGIVGEAPDCQQLRQPSWAWSAEVYFLGPAQGGAGRAPVPGRPVSLSRCMSSMRATVSCPGRRSTSNPFLRCPRAGDIICAPRGRGEVHRRTTLPRSGSAPRPCIATSVVFPPSTPPARLVKAIGGNVQQSVSMDEIELGDSGKLDDVTNSTYAVAAESCENDLAMRYLRCEKSNLLIF
ncbi:DUF2272 domain-containing protein [Cupriavidus basilensis]